MASNNNGFGWHADVSASITGRPGKDPRQLRVSLTNGTCPDILCLSDGNYLVIGTDVTASYADRLPTDAGCAPHERIVAIPQATLVSAASGITEDAPRVRLA